MAEFNPYSSPALPRVQEWRMPFHKVLFSFKGRIPRRTYWIYSVPLNVAMALLLKQLLALAEARHAPPPRSALPVTLETIGAGPPWQAYLILAAYLPLLWMKLAVLAKRWHDQNRSANWLVITFIPLVGMVINFLECGCSPGTRGENRYGPDPVPDPNARPPSPPVARPRKNKAAPLPKQPS
jgi:uncharacterized membrane protein YhaH (DUF805 family)